MIKVIMPIVKFFLWFLKLFALFLRPISKLIAKPNIELAKSFDAVEIPNRIEPKKDEDGNWVFHTDKDFKVLQISDIHLGAGWCTAKKDKMALNAIAAMVSEEKPDLIIVTGDMSYPVPVQSMTVNNGLSAKIVIDTFESLGVPWTVVFGNHDSELYSAYTREEVAKFYADKSLKHSIFEEGDENIDGVGNQIIRIENSQGITTKAFFLLDSHSYIDGDFLGIQWKYDNIHENQVAWYKQNVQKIDAKNKAIDSSYPMFESFAFFHIPLQEYGNAWKEFADNGYKDTADVKHIYGRAGEPNEKSYPGKKTDNLFDTMLELGSTKGVFVGHDHLNNYSLQYKGIRLTYSKTIDYLAYIGIWKKGAHRGCTTLELPQNAEFKITPQTYYQDKYQPKFEKEKADMTYIHQNSYDEVTKADKFFM